MIYLLTVSLLILTIVTVIVAIRIRFSTAIMVLLIPFLIFNIGFSYHTVKELWGYPVEGLPEDEVELIAYKVEQPNVFVMVRQQDGKTRLYMIPYTRKTEDQLEGAGKAMKRGQRMMMKDSNGDEGQDSKVEIYSWRPAESMPKEMR